MKRLKLNAAGGFCLTLLLAGAAAPDSPVADAAMRGDVDEVRALLRVGADVNAAQGDGMTALHWAAESGNVGLAEVLMYAGANLEAQTRLGGFTPLLVASQTGTADLVRTLLAAGADVHGATTTGETPLHFASAAGSAEAVSSLVAAGADVNARELTKGQTPLMFAAAYNRVPALGALLDEGADVSIETHVVDYPAMAANDILLVEQRTERLRVLHAEEVINNRPVDGTGADDDAEEEGIAKEVSDRPEDRKILTYDQLVGKQGGNTALHYAAREGHAEAAGLLLDRGAGLNRVSGGDHTSPLLIAMVNGHFDLAMRLLERGADANLLSDGGTSPLYTALHLQWAPNSVFPQPTTIRQEETTYLELMRALLDAGADPNPRLTKHLWFNSFNFDVAGLNTWGATPFWRAAYGTDVAAMRLLLEYGADPTIATYKAPGRESTGSTRGDEGKPDMSGLEPVPVGGPGIFPIHAASGSGYGIGLAGNQHRHAPNGWLPSVKFLIEEVGADVNERDYLGFTPLHNAAARGDVDMIMYLVEQGADVRVLTRKGETTADMANGPVQRVTIFPEVVKLLESLGSDNNHNCVSCQ